MTAPDKELQKVLPSFFVAGAQKAGTTSLHHWLVQQPDVCLPTIKETHFFSIDEKYDRGIHWYIQQFPDCSHNAVIGEVAPDYMFSDTAPQRISQWIDSPKFIFILRHPVERAYSNYLMSVRQGIEPLDFFNALRLEKQRMNNNAEFARRHYSYMGRSIYSAQIERFRNIFPHSSMLLIKFDDLVAPGDPGLNTYKKICEFIGIQSSHLLADREERANPASQPRSRILRNVLYGQSTLKSIIGRLIPGIDRREKIGAWLDRWNQKKMKVERLEAIPDETIRVTVAEIEYIENHCHLTLDDWFERTMEMARNGG